MSLWNKMKNTGLTAKLKGEIKLLELECNNRKKKFGIDLYDMLTTDKSKMLGISSGTLLGGQSHFDELRTSFDLTRQDISSIQAKKDMKQQELDVLEVKGPSSMPNTTMNDKMKQASCAVTNAGKEAKLKTEMLMLDREMKLRKEDFGLDIFTKVLSTEELKASGQYKGNGIGAKLRNSISGSNAQHEIDIQGCIDVAKADVTRIEGKIKSKEFEITSL